MTAGDQPDAAADQRAKTAAKTLADLAAADKAARAPLPHVAPVQVERPEPAAKPEPADADEGMDATGNASD